MEKIAENIYIIPGPTNVGVITDFQNQIYLIDSGTSNISCKADTEISTSGVPAHDVR